MHKLLGDVTGQRNDISDYISRLMYQMYQRIRAVIRLPFKTIVTYCHVIFIPIAKKFYHYKVQYLQ